MNTSPFDVNQAVALLSLVSTNKTAEALEISDPLQPGEIAVEEFSWESDRASELTVATYLIATNCLR